MNLSLFMHDTFNNTIHKHTTIFMVNITKNTNPLLYIFNYYTTHT